MDLFIDEAKLVARLKIDFLNSISNTLSKVNENTLNDIWTIKIIDELINYSFILTRNKSITILIPSIIRYTRDNNLVQNKVFILTIFLLK